ncbi:MAG TPA: DNRLRE domain-containing protein [Bacteroidia bacterium]|nr:DNRLRE domain-containing protein [Bacteroidia bacterium]
MKKITLLLCGIIFSASASAQINSSGLQFDGVDDYVQIPAISAYNIGTGDFTIEMWVKMNTYQIFSTSLLFLSPIQPSQSVPSLGIMYNNLSSFFGPPNSLVVYLGTTYSFSNVMLNSHTCRHLAVTRTSTTVSLYIDGSLFGFYFTSPTNITVPYYIQLGSNFYDAYCGFMQELRFWNVARIQSQIQNDMNSAPIGTGLIGYWKMDDLFGSVIDYSVNNNDGIRYGTNYIAGCSNCTLPADTIYASVPTTACNSVQLNAQAGNTSYQWYLYSANPTPMSGATSSTFTATASGIYFCRISNSCGPVMTNRISVTILPPAPSASITASGPTTFCDPGSVTLNANTGTGLSYQWRLNSVNITGATSSSYSATAAGNYNCVVSNSCGSSTSNTITVTVASPFIASISSGGPTTFCFGGNVTLNASPTGSGYTYQWRRNAVNISPPTMSSSYVAALPGDYDVVIYNGCTSTSNMITVTVPDVVAGTLFLQPNAANGIDALVGSYSTQANTNYGNVGEFNALAWTNSGNPAYQRSLLKFDLTSIAVTTIVQQASIYLYYNPTSSNGQHSSLSGSNASWLQKVTSPWSENTVTWNTQPTATTTNQVAVPQSASPTQDYIIDVTTLIQDMISNPTTNYGFLLRLQTEQHYRRLVFASSDNANPAKWPALSVSYYSPVAASITSVGSPVICQSASLIMNATPTGSAYSYQWRLNGTDITGATSSIYSTNAGGDYDCVVTSMCGSMTSNLITVTVTSTPPASITAAGPTTFCSPGSVTLNANTGSGYTYQWQLNNAPIIGATSSSFVATATGNYDCVVSNSCGSATSNTITVTVNPLPPAVITAGGPTTFCDPGSVTLDANTGSGLTYQWRLNGVDIPGETLSSYTATATGNYDCVVTNNCGSTPSNTITVQADVLPSAAVTAGGPTAFCAPGSVMLSVSTCTGCTYQWRESAVNISGANSSSYSATAAGNYDCVVTNTCGARTSNNIAVTEDVAPTASITAGGSTTFCSPGSVTLNANTGTGLSYQWRLNGGNISGATAASYSATATGNYDCVVSNTCGNVTSNVIAVTVNSAPSAAITAGGPITVCLPGSVTINANTGAGLSYQWRINGSDIPGATTSSYIAYSSGNYDCVVSNTCGSATSNAIAVTVNSSPSAVVTAAGSTTFCSPGSVLLNANTGTGLSYQWRLNGGNISGATSSFYTATATGNYDCVVSNICGSTTSNIISVTVNTVPPATITAGGSTTFCSPATVTLNANTGSGLSYQWKLNGANISGATASSYSASLTGNYQCVVTNICGSTTSNTITVTVSIGIPATPGSITGQTTGVCASTKTYSISAVSGATGYTWTVPSGASIGSGQGTTSVNVAFTSSFGSGNISVTASNSCGSSGASSTSVTGVPAQPGSINGPSSVCHHQNNVIYNIAAVTGATSYTWTVPPGTQIKTGQGTVQIKVRFGNSAGNITVKANNACGSGPIRSLAIAMPCREGENISSNDFDVNVFPNPSSSDFTFVINSSENNSCTISIFDLTGRVVEAYKNVSVNEEFKCGKALTDGIYYAEIISGDQRKVLKLVRQR